MELARRTQLRLTALLATMAGRSSVSLVDMVRELREDLDAEFAAEAARRETTAAEAARRETAPPPGWPPGSSAEPTADQDLSQCHLCAEQDEPPAPRPQLVTVEDLRVVVDPSGFPTFSSSAAAPRRSQSEALASQRSDLSLIHI